MARKIAYALVLEGELIAQTPIHIGGADSGNTTDMPMAVNGMGKHYIPGTSLAGAIRSWQRDNENAAWGLAVNESPLNTEGQASFYVVDDAVVARGDGLSAELWHGVGIDRKTGGAADAIKFDRQVLPQGSAFTFRMVREVESAGDIANARTELGLITAALQRGDISFGGGGTRGLGRMKLVKAVGCEINWLSKSSVLSWLADQTPKTECVSQWVESAGAELDRRGIISISIDWQPQGPLMSKAAADGFVVDMMPFVSRIHDGSYALTLPGSGIKGALRQHAERIMRTVLDIDMPVGEKHLDQLAVPLVSDLFGSAKPSEHLKTVRSLADARKALVSVDTCYAQVGLAQSTWTDLSKNPDAWKTHKDNVRQKKSGLPMQVADHVAIDRWTGGAADGALFNAVEPGKSVKWNPINLRFQCRNTADVAAFSLLWLLLRDLCEGQIPLGFGVNRGYGDLRVNSISFEGLQQLCPDTAADAADPDQLRVHVPDSLTLTTDTIRSSEGELVSLLGEHWKRWLSNYEQSTKESA